SVNSLPGEMCRRAIQAWTAHRRFWIKRCCYREFRRFDPSELIDQNTLSGSGCSLGLAGA
ncbi:MAG: hypothetical protein VYE16_01790, partial [Cyanobacteriota bacterium]|nr:hypothetical protein [Cyanobacteriota bacterium]